MEVVGAPPALIAEDTPPCPGEGAFGIGKAVGFRVGRLN
jgi:hypothetical protein